MLDHIGLDVSDYQKSKKFYEAALKPLDYNIIMEFEKWGGFGVGHKPDFWIGQGESTKSSPIHIAFRCETRETVDSFYQAALEAGGTDNGAPGPRPQYHPNYYGAFIIDPDGNNIEAVCHNPV